MRNRKPPILLLLGNRSSAVRAAHDLGCRVFILTKAPPLSSLKGLYEDYRKVSFKENFEDVRSSTLDLLGSDRPDAICALTEEAVVPAARLCEHFGIQSPSVVEALKCHNKVLMKQAVIAAGIPCAPFREISSKSDASELMRQFGTPLILKELDNSGGRGMVVARDLESIQKNLRDDCIAEGYVVGTEMSVESFVVDRSITFTNLTEYFISRWANILPARIEETLKAEILAFNERAIRALDIRNGMTHLEIFLTKNGLVFGEIALRPPGGHIMDLIQLSYGFNPWRVLLEIALGRLSEVQSTFTMHSGVLVLHPGGGLVQRIHGIELARKIEGVKRLSCRVKTGDRVGARIGAGDAKGYAICTGRDRDAVAETLRSVNKLVKFVMK